MESQERPEIPAELTTVHQLVWITSAIGPVLLGAGLLVSIFWSPEISAIGIVVCVILWLLAFAPLRSKARAIPPEGRVSSPDAPRWLVRAAGIGQIVCSVSVFFSPWGALIIPGNILAGSVIFIRILACHGMDLPTHRSRWGNVLVLLMFGTLWNSITTAAALARHH